MDRERLRASYDANADVLYISVGAPKPAHVVEEDGLLWRLTADANDPVGVTLLDFHEMRAECSTLNHRIALGLHVPEDEVERVIADAT